MFSTSVTYFIEKVNADAPVCRPPPVILPNYHTNNVDKPPRGAVIQVTGRGQSGRLPLEFRPAGLRRAGFAKRRLSLLRLALPGEALVRHSAYFAASAREKIRKEVRRLLPPDIT